MMGVQDDPLPYLDKETQANIIIVGLGNPILGDDGVGWRAAEVVEASLPADSGVDVACLALGGLSLMEKLVGYRQAIIIDAIQMPDGRPGEISTLALEDLPDLSAGHTTAVHDTSLQTALRLGASMGANLPDVVYIVGVEAPRVFDFSEELTPEVAAAVPKAAAAALALLDTLKEKQNGLT